MSSYSSYKPRTSYTRSTYGSSSGSRSSDQPALPPDRDIHEGLRSTKLQTLSKPVVKISSKAKPVKPENIKYIGSYNWVNEPQPTIIVPGSPPEWRERPLPYRVPYDTDVRFIDQNGFRMDSASCLLPIFRAVDLVAAANADTTLDWSAVDVVTDRNGLRKLLRWLQHASDEGAGGGDPPKEFRIDLQLGGRKTVLMHRWEKRTRELPVPGRSGCGINFERESTTPARGCERSTGHHRIVQYDLGGLNMVVRYEVDACIPQPASSTRTSTSTRSTSTSQPASPRKTSTDVDSLADMLASLEVASSPRTPPPSPPVTDSAAIAVIHGGTPVPQSSIVELATRSANYIDDFDWAEAYPQLLLSGTTHHFLAAHARGTFERIKKHALGSRELRPVENASATLRLFAQLADALRAVQDLVRERGPRGRLSLVCRDGVVRVFERTSELGAVPESDLERFGI